MNKQAQATSFTIGDRVIAQGEPCYVIAEAGLNHNGNPQLAQRLIECAAHVGADAIKFQTYRTEELFAPDHPEFDQFRQMEFGRETYAELKRIADENGIEFLSTPFDEECADLLLDIGVRAFKIGSGELNHLSFLREIAAKNLPTILSTGMSTEDQIDQAVRAIHETNEALPFALLHCVSAYPCPIDHANLRCIHRLRDRYDVPIGYSDHTETNTAPLAAVAMGACIVEKHFTLSKQLPGWDHHFSTTPEELAELVQTIRDVERAFGENCKAVSSREEEIQAIARRSIYVRRPIHEGDPITRDALVIRRPAGPMSADEIDNVIGAIATRNLGTDEALEPSAFEAH